MTPFPPSDLPLPVDKTQDPAVDRQAQFRAARQLEFTTTPPIVVDPVAAARYGARVLDPVTAMRLPGGGAPSPTVYVGERKSVV